MAIEEPQFTLSLKEGDFELRDYAACIVADVPVIGNQQVAGNKGFRLLAGYIFGRNATARKIAMTAPVTMIEGTQGDWLVRFTMPRRYALADLPAPKDAAVTLKSLPATRLAVLRFSGLAGPSKVAAKTAQLQAFAKSRGLAPGGPVALARYNPPWTPWFLRRNEVMLTIAAS